jgi:prepilin-type processing-associated H-X9-DG protein
MEPRDLKFDEMSFRINDPAREGIRSKHPGFANVVFCDMSSHSIREDTDPEVVKGLLTRNGGEDLNQFFGYPARR